MRKFPSLILLLSLAFFLHPRPSSSSGEAPKEEENYAPGEALAKTENSQELASVAAKNNFTVSRIETGAESDDLYLIKSGGNEPAQKIISALEKNPAIVSVQPNFKYKKLARTTNDRYFSAQWWFFDSASAPGGVSAASAWELESQKQGDLVVAVIDSGVNLKHKDLGKNIAKGKRKGKNFQRPKRKPTDDDGHGTFVAGIIAAVSHNKKGLAGASFGNNLKITPLRFDFTTAQAISALAWAKEKSIRVVSASWGGYGDEGNDLLLKDAIAQYPGVFVTASGNSGYDHDGADPAQKMYPCDFDLANIICAAATDETGNLAYYSDYGATSIDVGAPGGTEASPIMSISGSGQKYTHGEGSSLSAAFVSAEAGLLFSKYPNLSTAQAIEIIKNSVDQNASLAGRVSSGGKINFRKAFELAAGY